MSTQQSIQLLREIQSAETYFSDTKYQKVIDAAKRQFESGHSKGAMAILRSLPTDDQLLAELVEKLKGKSVFSTLERIREGKSVGHFTALKGLSSLLTHAVIECEKGSTEYRKLIPLILEKLNTLGHEVVSERKQ